uniref:Uncharacterized protein n=1 Tax=Plectus sambesii TaxID=2011161 RepID=A0A914WIR0_9BILA
MVSSAAAVAAWRPRQTPDARSFLFAAESDGVRERALGLGRLAHRTDAGARRKDASCFKNRSVTPGQQGNAGRRDLCRARQSANVARTKERERQNSCAVASRLFRAALPIRHATPAVQ